MIKIKVQNYCHECLDFEPDVEKPVAVYANTDGYNHLGDTIIRCEYRQRCAKIASHIQSDQNRGYGGACYIGDCGKNGTIDKKE